MRRRVAREFRVVGHRDGSRIDHQQAEGHQGQTTQTMVMSKPWNASGRPRAGVRPTRGRAAGVFASDRRRCSGGEAAHTLRAFQQPPRFVGELLHRRDEDLGAVGVVAEHVQAGAGRATAARRRRVARARSTSATASSSVSWRCSGTPRGRSAASMAAASRPISATARACAPRRGQRREVLALAVAAEDHDQLAGACRRPGR